MENPDIRTRQTGAFNKNCCPVVLSLAGECECPKSAVTLYLCSTIRRHVNRKVDVLAAALVRLRGRIAAKLDGLLPCLVWCSVHQVPLGFSVPEAPDGQQLSVTVPGGLAPGMSFEASAQTSLPGARRANAEQVPCRSGGYGGGPGLRETASRAKRPQNAESILQRLYGPRSSCSRLCKITVSLMWRDKATGLQEKAGTDCHRPSLCARHRCSCVACGS